MAKIQDNYYQFPALSRGPFPTASGGRRASPIRHQADDIVATPADLAARRNNSLYLAPPNSFAPVKKKKRGFFSRIGHAIKKFAGSKFGKLMLIGGAIAGSFLIPGLGAGIAKIIGGAGRALFGNVGEMFGQTGIKNLLQGGLKTFFKEQFLSASALKSRAQDLIGRAAGGKLLPPKISGVLGRLGKLASDFGFDREWLRNLISSYPAPPKNKPEYWL